MRPVHSGGAVGADRAVKMHDAVDRSVDAAADAVVRRSRPAIGERGVVLRDTLAKVVRADAELVRPLVNVNALRQNYRPAVVKTEMDGIKYCVNAGIPRAGYSQAPSTGTSTL